jgi:hypothetical protein
MSAATGKWNAARYSAIAVRAHSVGAYLAD